MSESSDDVEFGYTAWRCTNCGHEVPKNSPPCDRCGNMEFEDVEVREGDFDDEIRGPSNRQLLREHALTVGAGVAILLVVAVAALASAGVFVVSDPVGLGYCYGAVEAVPPDDDGQLTASEFHGRVAATYEDTSLRWYGRGLELSYQSRATSDTEVVDEITTIATWYATYVASGGDADRLQVTATIRDDTQVRETVASEDARRFASGEISEAEYRSRIFEGSS